MTQGLGVAVVGLGLAGSVMLEAVRAHRHAKLVAAVDPNETLRQRFEEAEGLPAFRTLAEALELPDVTVVYIASPHEYHAEQTRAAASAGRHVVVEKPMALSVDECSDMVDAAQDAQVVLVVGHTHGFDPGIARLAELVRDRTYGDVGHVAMWNYTNFLYRPRRPADLDPSQGGGVILNQVAHQVDMIRTIVDRDVTAVRAMTTRLDPRRPIDGSCTALLELEGALPVSLVYSGYDHFDTDELHGWVTESGRRGAARHGQARARLANLTHDESHERSHALSYGNRTASASANPAPTTRAHQPHFGEIVVSCTRADLRLTPDGVTAYTDHGVIAEPLPSVHDLPGHSAVLDELAAAIHTGHPPRHDGRFGRETVRVCNAIAESAATGLLVHMNRSEVCA